MLGVKFVAKLHDLAIEDGTITAFDSWEGDVFVGTSRGAVLKFQVSEEGGGGPGPSWGGHGDLYSSETPNENERETRIFTTQTAATLASEQKKKVASIQCAKGGLVFVLCAKKLAVFRGTDLKFLTEIANGIGAFFVSATAPITSRAVSSGGVISASSSSPPPASSTGGLLAGTTTSAATATGGNATNSETKLFDESRQQSDSMMHDAGADARRMYMISAAQKNNKGVFLYEYWASPYHSSVTKETTEVPSTTAASHRQQPGDNDGDDSEWANVKQGDQFNDTVVVRQDLLLPETVHSIVEMNGMLCVGMKREYSMVCLADGEAKSLLALNANHSGGPGSVTGPLLAIGDKALPDVFLRLHDSVFVVSMRGGMPLPGQALKHTIRFEETPLCIVARHPYVFVFCHSHCDVYSIYDDDVIERLPVEQCIHASRDTRKHHAHRDNLYFASASKLWMLKMYKAEELLSDMVDRYRIDDAFDLQQQYHMVRQESEAAVAEEARPSPSNPDAECAPPESLVILSREEEIELHIMAGFAHLYHNAPGEAMRHFNEHVDVREILLHLPELIPGSAEQQQQIATASGDDSHHRSQLSSGEESLLGGAHADGSYYDNWKGWFSQTPYNRYLEDIRVPWKSLFASFPDAPMRHQHDGTVYKLVPSSSHGGSTSGGGDQSSSSATSGHSVEMTEAEYVDSAMTSLKKVLILWLRSRLATADPQQRSAIEYSLIILFGQCGDRRSVLKLVENAICLDIEDSQWYLCAYEPRMYSLLLKRYKRKAESRDTYIRFLEKWYNTGSAEIGSSETMLLPSLDDLRMDSGLKRVKPRRNIAHRINNYHKIFFAVEASSNAAIGNTSEGRGGSSSTPSGENDTEYIASQLEFLADTIRAEEEKPYGTGGTSGEEEWQFFVDEYGNNALHFAVARLLSSQCATHNTREIHCGLSVLSYLLDKDEKSILANTANHAGHTPIDLVTKQISRSAEHNISGHQALLQSFIRACIATRELSSAFVESLTESELKSPTALHHDKSAAAFPPSHRRKYEVTPPSSAEGTRRLIRGVDVAAISAKLASLHTSTDAKGMTSGSWCGLYLK